MVCLLRVGVFCFLPIKTIDARDHPFDEWEEGIGYTTVTTGFCYGGGCGNGVHRSVLGVCDAFHDGTGYITLNE